jgi:hypothetical protein
METLGKQVRELLEKHGIKRTSKSWGDYELCKELIREFDLSSWEWYKACQIIADYLGL